MNYHEVNFDGLIGPTHNYAGLAFGNIASANNQGKHSNPRAAALQGLDKMRSVMSLGLSQGFLPPHDRPALHIAHALGYRGSDEAVIAKIAAQDKGLLANLYSASYMWTANAATIAPSPDSADGKVHFCPANLASHFHRSIEGDLTAKILRHIFADEGYFTHHPVLPGGIHFGDEGAANHGRLCATHGQAGLHLFVYGVDGDRFPARQRLEASKAMARSFGLDEEHAVFIQQSKIALDAGAFHNDVVGVTNGNVLFLHEQAFENQPEVNTHLKKSYPDLHIIEAPESQVSLPDAISTYLFNSQLLTVPDGSMVLLLPQEAQENDRVRTFLDEVRGGDNPIAQTIYKDVRESMRNGGGPACLRLRVVLSERERAATNPNFLLDEKKIVALEEWIKKYYRDRLHPDDLADPEFAGESLTALDALTQILNMGSFYSFQSMP